MTQQHMTAEVNASHAAYWALYVLFRLRPIQCQSHFVREGGFTDHTTHPTAPDASAAWIEDGNTVMHALRIILFWI